MAASGPAAYVIRWTGAHPTVLRLEGGVTRGHDDQGPRDLQPGHVRARPLRDWALCCDHHERCGLDAGRVVFRVDVETGNYERVARAVGNGGETLVSAGRDVFAAGYVAPPSRTTGGSAADLPSAEVKRVTGKTGSAADLPGCRTEEPRLVGSNEHAWLLSGASGPDRLLIQNLDAEGCGPALDWRPHSVEFPSVMAASGADLWVIEKNQLIHIR